MSARRSALLGLALCLASSLPGCAWANRENRRVWNAFEEHVVPEDGAWFVVSLPISVPLGFVAILVDVFVVHPAMIVDDALGDASDLWRDLEWEEHYYTEAAALPLRTAASPVWFAFAFLGRSTFDIRAYEPPLTAAEERARAAERDARNTEAWIAWFDALAAGSYEPMTEVPLPTWTEQLEAAFHGASRRATALGRAELYTTARHVPLPPWKASPWMGLDDPDPVVRHLVLVSLRAGTEVPDALRRALLEDPSETIRLLASRRWP